jgi:hypothetical protein
VAPEPAQVVRVTLCDLLDGPALIPAKIENAASRWTRLPRWRRGHEHAAAPQLGTLPVVHISPIGGPDPLIRGVQLCHASRGRRTRVAIGVVQGSKRSVGRVDHLNMRPWVHLKDFIRIALGAGGPDHLRDREHLAQILDRSDIN